MKSGSAAKYLTISTEDLCALPIKDVVEKDSACFLWSTVPMIEDALAVLKAWGYRYKTMVIWRKVMSLGMGYYFRGQVELCLLGVKGKVKAFRIQKPNIIQSKVREHSRKPDEFFELIKDVKLEPRLELFGRTNREGYTVIGYELDGKDIKESLKLLCDTN